MKSLVSIGHGNRNASTQKAENGCSTAQVRPRLVHSHVGLCALDISRAEGGLGPLFITMYGKIFERITQSSLMEEDITTRYVFIMLIAISDLNGDVIGTDIAIARRLNIDVVNFVNSVNKLNQPDRESNSKECDGRRIIPSENGRGYHLVNYVSYRNIHNDLERREYMRKYMQKYRCKQFTCLQDVNSASVFDSVHSPSSLILPSSSSSKSSQTAKSKLAEAEEIYAVYPRKVGRPIAIRAIVKALQIEDAGVLLERTKSFAAARAGQDPQFTPHPSTWFNQQRWKDDPTTWNGKPHEKTLSEKLTDELQARIERHQREFEEDERRRNNSEKTPAQREAEFKAELDAKFPSKK